MKLSNGEDALEFTTIPHNSWGVAMVGDYGTLNFSKAGLYRIELAPHNNEDYPGIQCFWQIELAPLD